MATCAASWFILPILSSLLVRSHTLFFRVKRQIANVKADARRAFFSFCKHLPDWQHRMHCLIAANRRRSWSLRERKQVTRKQTYWDYSSSAAGLFIKQLTNWINHIKRRFSAPPNDSVKELVEQKISWFAAKLNNFIPEISSCAAGGRFPVEYSHFVSF